MAGADYYPCDRCGSKVFYVFYDSNVGYPPSITIRALCADCSKTHTIAITERGWSFTADQVHMVEGWLRAAARYGWDVAQARGAQPDPLLDWSDGYPRIVVDGAEINQMTDNREDQS